MFFQTRPTMGNKGYKACLPQILALLLVLPLLLLPPSALAQENDYAMEVMDLLNQRRAGADVPPLTYTDTLQEAALIRATENAESFSHTRPDGTSWSTVFPQEEGSHMRGELLAKGLQTPEAVVESWARSGPQNQLLMDEKFTQVAVGHTVVDETPYWCVLFYTPDESTSTGE